MDPDAIVTRIQSQLGSSATPPLREEPPHPPPRVPDHELIARIGGGSYGEVWLARSVTGGLHAVKIVWRHTFSSERPYEREFKGIVQFEPLSRSHPGVVNILHVGRDDAVGCFYYVMELADNANAECEKRSTESIPSASGSSPRSIVLTPHSYAPRTLASDIRARGRIPIADVVTLGVQLANALGYLHRHGLVHRDVKPSNVIFVNGQPKLADIGLVTGVDEARSFVGTEGFIPPEGPGSEQADIFSLGRLLYEAATGKDRCEFPMLPADLDRWPQHERATLLELNELLARACAANPKDRHANAAELAGDLNLILAGRSVRHAYGLERRLRQARRISIAAGAVILLTTGLVWFQRKEQNRAEALAARETALRQRAEAAERESQHQLYAALLEQARATVNKGELGQRVRTLEAIQRAVAISNTLELRQTAFAALALPDLRLDREITFAEDEGGRVCDPTFERYAVCVDRGSVEIRTVADQRLLASLPAAAHGVGYVKNWSADGRYLAIKRDVDGSYHGDLEVWNLVSTQRVLHVRDHVVQRALSFHPTRAQIAAGSFEGRVAIWNLENGEKIRQFQLPARPYWLSFAPDGQSLAVSYTHSGTNLVRIIDTVTGTPQTTIPCPDIVLCVAWQPHGPWIAIPDLSSQVRLIDPKTGEVRILGHHKAQAVDAVFSPNGDFLITGGWERELIAWDMRTLQRAVTIGINSERAQFSANGRKCAIHVADRLQIYEFQLPDACRELPGDLGQAVFFGEFSPESRWFSAGGDKFIGVWDVHARGLAATIPTDAVRFSFFSRASNEIYAPASGFLGRWRIASSENERVLELTRLPLWSPSDVLQATAVSKELVLFSSDGLRLMPLANTKMDNVRHLKMVGSEGRASPDGRWFGVTTRWSPVLGVYRFPDFGQVASITNRADVLRFTFSPSGDELAVVTQLGVEFYETVRWQRKRELPIGNAGFAKLHFAPDGKSFWLTSDRRTAALRDTRTLEVLLPLPPGTLPLALSSDGRHLAVSVDLQRVQLWDLPQVRERLREIGLDWEERKTAINANRD